MSLDLLNLLSGDDQQFAQGLVELGWYDYAPVLTDYCLMGKARACLDPQLRAAGEVRGTDAWVYRLDVPTGRWQDAVAVVESHLKQDPQFAVVFCNVAGALLILVPSNPDKAFGRAKSGLAVDRIYLDTRQPSNFEAETIKKLKEAPKKHFRARLQDMVNTERVTKKFYDRFKKELDSFQKLIDGITVEADRLWYSSVMLNRLMFIYFLQRKGFLDGDRYYLSNRLKVVRERRGKDEFQSFYRCFLLRLFHEGLGSRNRELDFEELLGRIPYLNGGLFEVHDIESRYVDDAGQTVVDIPDDAFESVFSFFNDYEWCLDTRPSRTEREINPDVLGYIFEKYINQKQMGAYYTKEDITEYISKNTIIPYVFDTAEKKHKAAFEGDDSVWLLLQIDPNRYIYDAVQKGVELDLPEDIACGLDDVSKRDKWNTPAPEEYALPTEIWREVVARRKRYAEVRGKLERGEVKSIDDLITLNLNIIQFARDVIDITDSPELIRAIWNTVAGRIAEIGTNASPIPPMTVLDPTCGSGAFLFAALNILEPLYEGCLNRMQAFVAQADSTGDSRKYPDFRSVLARMNDIAKHPNREYFILKSIILNNLYGVDLMEEAVEICKLRLFLKMASVVEPDESRDNYGLEPLPDIDFNIQAGNTLVGYASEEEIRGATIEGKAKQLTMMPDGYSGDQMELIGNIDESPAFKRIKDKLAIVDAAYDMFRRQQVELGGEVTAEDKQALRNKLRDLDDDLNRYLAKQYDIDASRHTAKYAKWLDSHRPFHWFVEFYGIMRRGGFDVIIGNPPYVVYSESRTGYRLDLSHFLSGESKNTYAYVFERSVNLGKPNSPIGLIVQMTVMSSERMSSLQNLIANRGNLCALSFPRRPESMFDGVEMPVTIVLSLPCANERYSTSRVGRIYTEERQQALEVLSLVQHDTRLNSCRIAKVGSELQVGISHKLMQHRDPLDMLIVKSSDHVVYYQEACRYWTKAVLGAPFFKRNGVGMNPPHGRYIHLPDEQACCFTSCLMNSSLFYWYYSLFSDCEHINDELVRGFPVSNSWSGTDWKALWLGLSESLERNAQRKTITTKEGHRIEYDEIKALKSKPIIDEIDRALAKHYSFTDEELDFIINYDIKYRMGINGNGDAEEDE